MNAPAPPDEPPTRLLPTQEIPAAGQPPIGTPWPLRIAQVMPPWFDVPPRGYGGIECLAADLCNALIDRGHEVFLVGAGTNGTRARFLRTFEEPPSQRIGRAIPEVLHAAWSNLLLDQLDVDVIHDHSLAGPITARSRPVPTVLTAHGPCTGEMATYYRSLSREVRLVAISDSQRRLAADLAWSGRVHNALNTADFPFRSEKDDYVLFIGRFDPTKGAHLAIDAARDAGRPIVLAGKLQEELEWDYFDAEVRPRLGSDADFVGEVDMAGKKELYARARCLVFPIRWEEPFGMVMIESMACGTPVVALRRGSVPEVVVDGVTGFVRDHVTELPAAIDLVGELDAAACRRHVERYFDVSVMTSGYERVYAGAARPAGAARAVR